MSTTCVKTVVGCKQEHAPCKILPLKQILFPMSIEFHGDHKTHKFEVNLPLSIFRAITGFLTLVSVCLSPIKDSGQCFHERFSVMF